MSIALRAALWLATVAGVATLWASYLPAPGQRRLDVLVPFTQLVALRPFVAAVLLVIAAAGLLLTRRRRGDAAAFALLLTCSAAAWVQVAPRVLSHAAPPRRGEPAFTVLTANTLQARVAPRVIVDLVRRTDADVVALTETHAVYARAIARALARDRDGRWRTFRDTVAASGEASARPTSLLVRAELGAVRLADGASDPRAHGQVRVRLTRIPGGSGRERGPAIAAVHPRPPAPIATQVSWRRDLAALRPLCRAGWIVAGDLNATVDHSPMRALLRDGCSDVAAATGKGLRNTWTTGPLGVIRLVIDHVLTSGRWRAAASGVLLIAGSDHRALWARITTAD